MFNVRTQQVILEIPKNGSRSLVQASLDNGGKQYVKCHGHHTIEAFLTSMQYKLVAEKKRPEPPVLTLAVIRNPVDRLLSQLQHAKRHKVSRSLAELMQIAWEQSDIVFKPQWQFVQLPEVGDYDIDLRMWDMKRIGEALEFIAERPAKYHKNEAVGTSPITKDSMMEHPLFMDLMESEQHYAPDFKLWIRAERTDKEGRE